MKAQSPVVHVCFGSTDEHLEELERCATYGAEPEDWWTIHKGANPGEIAAFYMIHPRKAFVATGVVAENSYLKMTGEFAGKYCAHIDGIRMLKRPVHLHEARAKFPNWSWLRLPRRSARVPSEFASPFLSFLDAHTRDEFATEGDLEGLRIETLQLRTTRSKRLRDLALQSANGICAVCLTNFSKVLRGRGVRVLQVHHRKQLSRRKSPSITNLGDLVVVCANCHLLLHLDPDNALTVDELRRMLRSH